MNPTAESCMSNRSGPKVVQIVCGGVNIHTRDIAGQIWVVAGPLASTRRPILGPSDDLLCIAACGLQLYKLSTNGQLMDYDDYSRTWELVRQVDNVKEMILGDHAFYYKLAGFKIGGFSSALVGTPSLSQEQIRELAVSPIKEGEGESSAEQLMNYDEWPNAWMKAQQFDNVKEVVCGDHAFYYTLAGVKTHGIPTAFIGIPSLSQEQTRELAVGSIGEGKGESRAEQFIDRQVKIAGATKDSQVAEQQIAELTAALGNVRMGAATEVEGLEEQLQFAQNAAEEAIAELLLLRDRDELLKTEVRELQGKLMGVQKGLEEVRKTYNGLESRIMANTDESFVQHFFVDEDGEE